MGSSHSTLRVDSVDRITSQSNIKTMLHKDISDTSHYDTSVGQNF
jgi:hypothetical protein